jgi:hypothetical protein
MLVAPLLLASTLVAQSSTQAYSSTVPVQVSACELSPSPVAVDAFDGIRAPGAGSLRVAFVNRSAKTISSVQFAVSDGQATANVVDAGTFSRDITIDHTFIAPALSSDVSCSVQSIAFADGTTWQAQ